MKIAVLGGMVNNTYIMAKVLKQHGWDVVFIRDPEDFFIPHQPLWVDKKIEVESTQLFRDTIDDCLAFDQLHHWSPPSWYINPLFLEIPSRQRKFKNASLSFTRLLGLRRMNRSIGWIQILQILKNVDYVLACGISAAILARLSNKPYVCWSHGGDVRKMMNLENVLGTYLDHLYDKMTVHLLKDAHKNALAVGFNYGEKIYCSGGIHRKEQLYMKNSAIIPFPAFYCEVQKNEDSDTKIQETNFIESDEEFIKILVPSRIDFLTKGHDKLLKSLQRLGDLKKFKITVTGWGQDQNEFVKLIKEKGFEKNIIVKKTMLSRPLLHELIKSHDLIIDQFNIGIYGTATLEAMSLGKPVMMYLDTARSGHEEIPPIINCSTEDQIFDSLLKIKNKEIDLEKVGFESKNWAKKFHGNDVFVESLKGFFT